VWVALLAAGLVGPVLLSGVLVVSELNEDHPDRVRATVGLALVLLVVVVSAAALWVLRTSRRELHRRSQVISAAAVTSRDWAWESDAEDRITYSNDTVTELLGYLPEDLIGVLQGTLMADDATRSAARALTGQASRGGDGWDDVEMQWLHRNGSIVALQGSAVALRDRSGHVIGFRGTRRPGNAQHHRAVLVAARKRVTELLATGQVTMALQPIVDVSTGRLAGVEALARFADGRGPDQWFGDAQVAGKTRDLDELAFNTALLLFKDIPAPTYLSLNASPDLLMDPSFVDRLLSLGLPLHRLVIEITEHARVADYDALNRALAPLRAEGVGFAIDDTGAGYASLSHVLQLAPNVIKLDRALIANLDEDRARRSLVTALVLLALEMGATVTGEGVETEVQRSALATLGVDQVQGYLLARPTTDRRDWADWWGRTWVTDGTVATRPAATR
jgi:PAS domain S-box-containing protein